MKLSEVLSELEHEIQIENIRRSGNAKIYKFMMEIVKQLINLHTQVNPDK